MNGAVRWTGRTVFWGFAALLVLLPLTWVPLSLQLPLGRDQGIFAWVAEVVLGGGLPYADAWEIKGPFAHFLYVLAFALFGTSTIAIRIFDLLMLALAAWAFLRLARMSGRTFAGVLGFGITFILFGTNYWDSAQPDGWGGTFLLWMVILLLTPPPKAARFLGAGALLGLVALIKPPYAVFGLIAILYLCIAARDQRPWRLMAFFTAGAAIPIVLCVIVYAAAGKLDSLWDTLILFNLEIHLERPSPEADFVMTEVLAVIVREYLFVAPLIASGVLVLIQTARRTGIILLVAMILAFVFAVVQDKFYSYHFMPFEVFAGIFAGFGLVHIFDLFTQRGGVQSRLTTRIVAIFVVLIAAVITLRPLNRTEDLAQRALGQMTEKRWQDGFCMFGVDFCYRDVAGAAEFLRRHTPPGTPVYVWGFDALVYFLAERPSPTRFGYVYPLVAGTPEHRERFERELMDDLSRSPPAFIAVQVNDENSLTEQASRDHLGEFASLKDMIARDYVLAYGNRTFEIYRPKPSAAQRSGG